MTHQDPKQPRKRPRLGVSAFLLVVALVPMLGVGLFAQREYRQTQTSSATANQIRVEAKELVELVNLRAAIIDERNWTVAVDGIEEFGIQIEIAESLLGVAFTDELDRATAKVNDLAEGAGQSSLIEDIATARVTPWSNTDEVNVIYAKLDRTIAGQSNAISSRLLAAGGAVNDGGDLLVALRTLEAAIEMRRANSEQMSMHFSAKFPSVETAAGAPQALAAEAALYEEAFHRMSGIPVDPTVTAVLTDIQESSDLAIFETAVDELINTVFRSGLSEDSPGLNVAEYNDMATTFLSGVRLGESHLELVNTAGESVTRASQAVAAGADSATRSAVQRIAAVSLLSLLVAATLAQFIARPLRKVARSANLLRFGEVDTPSRLEGPREVQAITAALNEAAGHLELAERQATALAEGNLQHPALAERAPGRLGASLQEAVQTLTESLAEREDFRRRLAHETSHDALTGLPNRNTCLNQLERSLARSTRSGASVAVFVIDIDNFNHINDRYGHPAGDRVLRAVAVRLINAFRSGDQVGRLAGDEFIAIAEPVAGPNEALELAHRLSEALAEPLQVDGNTLKIQTTIGVAITDSGDLTADEMLRDADLAVHKVKASGQGGIELCDESLRAEIVARSDLEQAIRDAITNDEFTMVYQPIVQSETLQVLSAEALVRWNRPGHGMVFPGDFIPLAERSDLIIELDRWVIRSVAYQISQWDDTAFANVDVSLNVSGRHLAHPNFVAHVLDPLDDFSVEHARLVVEVTESAMLDDLGDAARKLQQLRDAGVRIAIDDFGTGYTSLAHLKTLPMDFLKIDRSFTNDPKSESLLQLIIQTGHLLGASICAEGIETPEQAQNLQALKCDFLQGYFFARPGPPEELPLQGRDFQLKSQDDATAAPSISS